MKQTRRSRLVTAILGLCVLLFAQLALAGYHCAGAGVGEDRKARQLASPDASAPCAEHMPATQDEAPELCHAHCQMGQQKVDTHQTPAPTLLHEIATGLKVEPAPLSPRVQIRPRAWRPPSSPPLSVQNCCFRI